MARITVVNDNPDFLALMNDLLEDERYEVTIIDGDRADALEAITVSRPDLLILDLRLGTHKLHGWDIAQQLRGDPAFAGLPVVICSGDIPALHDVEADLTESMRTATLTKPFALHELTELVSRMLEERAPA